MKKTIVAATFLVLLSLVSVHARTISAFDADWRFLQADASGAEQPPFADVAWHAVSLPHDWSIAGPFAETNKAEGAGAFLPTGVAWYRKYFSLPKNDSDKIVSVEFDGVMANSDVWINGFHLGHRPSGYVSFSYELTGHLNFGGDNVIAVRCDTSAQPASRWYAGGGIYRHVRLEVTDTVHIEENGVFVSTPKATADTATVAVQTTITNSSSAARSITVQTSLVAPGGKTVATVESAEVIAAGMSAVFKQQINLSQPQLWNLDDPKLYRAVSKVLDGQNNLDETVTTIGIRDAHFDAATGFWLNGKNFKLYGVCLHSEGGAFGAAVPLGVWEQRLTALRQLGVNAIRTAHNPPAPEFLDLCDRMGFLVMDEFFDCWTVAKNPYDYHLYFDEWSQRDAADNIRRDRNHPSIVLYSVGNEIHDTPNEELSKKILSGLVAVCHTNDPTRPVTQALFRPNVSHDYDNGLADLLDVVGTNYRDNELLAAQRAKPSRKIIGTEQRHDRQTWLWLRDNPSHSGQFLWTGVDYLGESRHWPVIGAASGLLDRTAAPKPMGFERQSWWSTQPMVFMCRRIATERNTPTDPGFAPLDRRQGLFADWTPANPAKHDENVEIYSNCQEVELFLNGKSLGAKKINADASPRNWPVVYAPGTLKAIAKNNGKVVATQELRTAGKPAKIVLSADQARLAASWDGVCAITVTVTDKNDVIIPHAADLVSFAVSGPGVVAAVDNADNSSHEPFQATQRHAYQGRCVAFVKALASKGKISIVASAPGLKSGKLTIETTAGR